MSKGMTGAAALAVLWLAPGVVMATEVQRAPFGTLPDGGKVEAITLANSHGIKATIITLGASVQSVITPDKDGKPADIALGYPSLDGYLAKPNFFGATVGRFANRVAKGRFSLDGKAYQLTINDGPNSLHGGTKGFDKVNWEVVSVAPGREASVALRYVSPDGDQGYPGTMTVTATYTLDEDGNLSADYKATTDKATIVNLSNHTYWNLAGEGAPGGVMDQLMTIHGSAYLPTDATAIPTGEIRPVEGTPFDFRQGKPIGRDIRDGHDQQLLFGKGYDHNWVIGRAIAAAPHIVAHVVDPKSGRILDVISNQPGLQFYSGNFLDGTIVGKSGRTYRQGDAFVLEPQIFPDTPNRPEFGSARLDPGQTYHNHVTFRFSTLMK